MKRLTPRFSELAIAITAVTLGAGATVSMATEPCGDFGECKALIEINSSDGDVGFLELNAITAALLDAIEFNEDRLSGEQLLRALADKIDYPDADALVAHGADALLEMRQLEILSGTRDPA